MAVDTHRSFSDTTLCAYTYTASPYICSALSGNLGFLQKAQRFLGFPRKRDNVQFGMLSRDPQKAQCFLGIPRKCSVVWESLESTALSGNSQMAHRFPEVTIESRNLLTVHGGRSVMMAEQCEMFDGFCRMHYGTSNENTKEGCSRSKAIPTAKGRKNVTLLKRYPVSYNYIV